MRLETPPAVIDLAARRRCSRDLRPSREEGVTKNGATGAGRFNVVVVALLLFVSGCKKAPSGEVKHQSSESDGANIEEIPTSDGAVNDLSDGMGADTPIRSPTDSQIAATDVTLPVDGQDALSSDTSWSDVDAIEAGGEDGDVNASASVAWSFSPGGSFVGGIATHSNRAYSVTASASKGGLAAHGPPYKVHSITADTGTVVWTRTLTDAGVTIVRTPSVRPDSSIVVPWIHWGNPGFGTFANQAYVTLYAAATGTAMWTIKAGPSSAKQVATEPLLSRCAAVDATNSVYVVASDVLTKISPGGSVVWVRPRLGTTPINSNAQSSPVVWKDNVYYVSRLGELVGTTLAGKHLVAVKLNLSSIDCGVIASPAIGLVVATVNGGSATYGATGKKHWTHSGGGACAAIRGDGVVVRAANSVIAFAAGVTQWTVAGPGTKYPPSILDDGSFFSLGFSGTKHGRLLLDPNGKVLDSGTVAPAYDGATPWKITATGRVVYTSGQHLVASDWATPAKGSGSWSGLDGGPTNRRSVH